MTRWLDAREAAEHMGFAPKTLANWRAAEQGPRFRRVGRAIRYDAEELDRYIEANGQAA
jgi:predicted DNA-binding transcriptional regulator AlpA